MSYIPQDFLTLNLLIDISHALTYRVILCRLMAIWAILNTMAEHLHFVIIY